MTVRVVTAPEVEPISLNEAKLHLFGSVTFTSDDALITTLIAAARHRAETLTRRALVYQTLELTLPCFPADGVIEIPRPPLQSVISVRYIDTDGTLTTVAASEYQVDTYREPGIVKPAYLESWDATRSGEIDAVQVRYYAGYTPGSPQDQAGLTDNIPDPIKVWIKMRVATMYEHRETINVGNIVSAFPRDHVDGMLDGYIVSPF